MFDAEYLKELERAIGYNCAVSTFDFDVHTALKAEIILNTGKPITHQANISKKKLQNKRHGVFVSNFVYDAKMLFARVLDEYNKENEVLACEIESKPLPCKINGKSGDFLGTIHIGHFKWAICMFERRDQPEFVTTKGLIVQRTKWVEAMPPKSTECVQVFPTGCRVKTTTCGITLEGKILSTYYSKNDGEVWITVLWDDELVPAVVNMRSLRFESKGWVEL